MTQRYTEKPKRRTKSYDGYGLTQTECAKRLGISRKRVSQIELRALRKMKDLVESEFDEGEE